MIGRRKLLATAFTDGVRRGLLRLGFKSMLRVRVIHVFVLFIVYLCTHCVTRHTNTHTLIHTHALTPPHTGTYTRTPPQTQVHTHALTQSPPGPGIRCLLDLLTGCCTSREGRALHEVGSILDIPGNLAAIIKLHREDHRPCVRQFLCEQLQHRILPEITLTDIFV